MRASKETENQDWSSAGLTLLLLAPLPSVADLDGADADDDGHDEEEDATDETSRDCPPLDILRHGVPEEIYDDNDDDDYDEEMISPEGIAGSVGRGRVGVDPEDVGLGGAHVLDWRE